MIVDTVDRQTIRAAVELGGHAPSVHNSQPWRWRLGRRSLLLQADLRRWLPATDADGRDLVVSCGATLHHTRVALAASGVHAVVHRIPDPDRPDDLAALELSLRSPVDADVQLAAAILRRRTDRRRYSTWEVPESMRAALVQRAAQQGALLQVVTGNARRKLEATLRDAAATQDDTPAYQTETAVWSGVESGDDGIPAANLLAAAPDPAHARRFTPGRLLEDPDGEPDGAVYAVIGTASDDTLSQLRAGEAMSAVILQATLLGLASCPLSQVLEVGDTRRALRDDVLDGAMAPQLVLRLGFAPSPPLPATPRRPIGEYLYAESD
jgi:nitroreductase